MLSSGQYATVAGTAKDPCKDYVEELMSATNVVDTLAGIHRVEADEPEEDFMLLRLSFTTWVLIIAHPALEERWVDVRYADLVDDPKAVVNDIYARLGWPHEATATRAMQEWLALQEEQRRHEPPHE